MGLQPKADTMPESADWLLSNSLITIFIFKSSHGKAKLGMGKWRVSSTHSFGHVNAFCVNGAWTKAWGSGRESGCIRRNHILISQALVDCQVLRRRSIPSPVCWVPFNWIWGTEPRTFFKWKICSGYVASQILTSWKMSSVSGKDVPFSNPFCTFPCGSSLRLLAICLDHDVRRPQVNWLSGWVPRRTLRFFSGCRTSSSPFTLLHSGPPFSSSTRQHERKCESWMTQFIFNKQSPNLNP